MRKDPEREPPLKLSLPEKKGRIEIAWTTECFAKRTRKKRMTHQPLRSPLLSPHPSCREARNASLQSTFPVGEGLRSYRSEYGLPLWEGIGSMSLPQRGRWRRSRRMRRAPLRRLIHCYTVSLFFWRVTCPFRKTFYHKQTHRNRYKSLDKTFPRRYNIG